MKKKKGGGGGANWMDTYGDMVTLLLCFFVLLYSMSTIDEEKWKALVVSFNPNAVLTQTDPQGNAGPVADPDNMGGEPLTPDGDLMSQEEIDNSIEELYKQLLEYSAQEGMENTLSVTMEGGRVYVTFNQTTFFAGYSAQLLPESLPVLDKVCAVLSQAADAIDMVEIQGHTAQDTDQPNTVKTDRTLSSDRATNVLIYIQENSELSGAQLVSMGMGQWYPVAENNSPENRAKNRRVELIISGRNLQEELGADSITHFEIN